MSTINVDNIAEYTSAGGVTIDGVNFQEMSQNYIFTD